MAIGADGNQSAESAVVADAVDHHRQFRLTERLVEAQATAGISGQFGIAGDDEGTALS